VFLGFSLRAASLRRGSEDCTRPKQNSIGRNPSSTKSSFIACVYQPPVDSPTLEIRLKSRLIPFNLEMRPIQVYDFTTASIIHATVRHASVPTPPSSPEVVAVRSSSPRRVVHPLCSLPNTGTLLLRFSCNYFVFQRLRALGFSSCRAFWHSFPYFQTMGFRLFFAKYYRGVGYPSSLLKHACSFRLAHVDAGTHIQLSSL